MSTASSSEQQNCTEEQQITIIAQALAQRYMNEENDSVQEKQYNETIRKNIQQEKPVAEKLEEANTQMLEVDTVLEEKCAETFAKLPKYTEMLGKIHANLGILATNARKMKELSAEVAKECDIDISSAVASGGSSKQQQQQPVKK